MNFSQAGTKKNDIGGIHSLLDNAVAFLEFKNQMILRKLIEAAVA